jgi:hypothetical protein
MRLRQRGHGLGQRSRPTQRQHAEHTRSPCRLHRRFGLTCSICVALTDNLVNDARERCGGVDDHTVFRNAFFRSVQSRSDFPFRLFSAPVSGVHCHPLSNPPVHCVKVNFKDKNAVKQIDELCSIPRSTAEKRDRLIPVGDAGLYFIYMPNVVRGNEGRRALVRAAIRRCTGFRMALIGQFPVTMNGMVAAPLQFGADRRLAGAGNACNQIIPHAHGWRIPPTR